MAMMSWSPGLVHKRTMGVATPECVHEVGVALQGRAAAKDARCLVGKYRDILLVAVA